ncbi:psbP domain-containing protein 7, chloroplastic-like isoform X2 [Primulina tabacum]|uniref:psbP domain-containing protein 7, chloroplastic-like isoform X2 n=1 Tax=Primulina tabacum TaxID=48773 RepID=UPI003F59654C
MKYDYFGKKKMKIISIHRNLWRTCKFDSHRRIHMAQSSNDGESNFQPPADQFRPLQTVFRRRLIAGVSAASLLSVGANFGGITSFFLSFFPEEARHLKLDALYPVRGYSRYIDTYLGFEFIYPESWLGDQTVAYRAAEKAERLMDPPPLGSVGRRSRSVNEPVVAFGPPGSTGELNISVIVAPVSLDFSIETFGGAEEVGEAIVGTITGRSRGSVVKGTLIASSLRQDSVEGVKFYELEFEVESPTFHRHNVAVCCVRKGRLFTLNAQSPESLWPEFKSQFYTIADSFNLV